jgi:hypothetical protein
MNRPRPCGAERLFCKGELLIEKRIIGSIDVFEHDDPPRFAKHVF